MLISSHLSARRIGQTSVFVIAMGGVPRAPDADYDDAVLAICRNGENIKHGKQRFYAIAEYQLEAFGQLRASAG